MLRDHGVEDPGSASVDHLSSAIHANYDPVTVALALAQASGAETEGRSLHPHHRLHLMHHAAAQRGHFANGGGLNASPGRLMHPALAAAYAAMNRPRFDDGGTVMPDNALGSTPDPDPAPYSGDTGSTPIDRGIAAIPAYAAHVAQGFGDAVTLPRDVMQGSVDPMSDEGIARTASLATMLPAGGMPMAEAGALGSAGGAMTIEKLKSLWDLNAEPLAPHPELPPASAAELQHRIDSLNPNGLPVDEASRLGRARDLGFDTSVPLYHGTTSPWEGTGFRETDGRTHERATFLTPDPQVANAYARAFNSTEGNILPVYARMRNPKVLDMQGSGYASASVHDAIENARNAGHDGVVFHNMLDLSGPNFDEVPQTQVAVFHPRNIRSVFGTFDPAMEGSTDLMSAGGLNALPASSTASNDQLPYGQPPVVGPDGVTRGAFADGGVPLQPNGMMHPAVAAALAAANQRPHFDDGGGEGEGSSRSGGSSSSGGDSNGGDGHGNSGDSGSSSSSSGSAGGVGGFGGSSSGDGYGGGSSSGSSGGVGGFGGNSGNDGYGGNSSSSTSNGVGSGYGGSSSGSAGGVGGFGGGSSDGYGGGSSSSSGSNSNASSGSSGGVGGFGGGSSDGYGGGSSSGTQSSGGFSSGAASGADSGGVGGSVGGTDSGGGVMGGAGLSGGAGYGSSSGSSGDVGSMGGSYGAPAAGGFSSEGAPSTGGFGNFGAGPTANDTSGGLTGATPSASMMSGQTAGQSMSNEAANGSSAGEDGTGSMNGVSSTGAFGSFGPSMGTASPYGSMANAQAAFGNSSVGDGTTGATPSSVGASNPEGVSGLSPSGQMMGIMGMSGIDTGIAGASNVGKTGALSGPGAYGFSTDHMAGFDNFGRDGSVTQSSLGAVGYTGRDNAEDQATAATQSNLGAPTAGYVGGPLGLGTSPAVAGALAAAGQTDAPAATPAEAYHGVDPAVIGGMFGDIGDVFGGFKGREEAGPPAPSVAPSPYGTLSKTPMGPLNVGSLGQAMGTDRTSDTAGLNADGDPTAVNGMSALTVHGTLTPGAQAMSDGVPAGPGIVTHMSPSYAAADGLAANRVYSRTADAQDSGAPPSMIANTAGRDTQSLGMGFNPSSMTDTSFGPSTPDTSAPGITDSQVAQARQNLQNGTGTDQDRATVQTYLNQQNTPSDGMHPSVAKAMAAAGSDTTTGPLTVSPQTLGDYTTRMQKFESGNDPNAVSPTGAFGLSQFTQGTWAGVRQNYPGLNLPANLRDATAEQQASATDALTNENVRGLQKVGITPTYAAVYAAHNAGISVAKGIFSAPDNASVSSVVPARTIAANPQVFGGMDNIGQLKGHLADIMGQGVVASAPAPVAPGRYANYSPGAASGMDTTAPASFNGISPESTYSPGVATPGTEPTTQTVTTPAPYGVSPEVQHALTINGLAPTLANALAADTLGVANGVAVMNGPPSDPISSVDISPETVQAHPDLFSGVQTIGDLQGKIAAAAPTAGFTTQQVTTPGTPAVNGLGDLPGYSYSPGAASGLDTPDTSAQETGISQPGVYGTPSPLTIARGVLAGQQPTDAGFSPGAASGADTAMDHSTPDGAPAKHLSVPNWAGNGLAGMAAGSLLGPAGTLLGMGNTISGWMGGPTAADGINAALAHPGAPTGVTGGGDNTNAGGREGPYNQPYVPGGAVGDGTGNGNNPQATSTAPAPDGALPYSAPPLTIRRRHQYYDTTTPSVSFYNPMTDPAVARALAAMRS